MCYGIEKNDSLKKKIAELFMKLKGVSNKNSSDAEVYLEAQSHLPHFCSYIL